MRHRSILVLVAALACSPGVAVAAPAGGVQSRLDALVRAGVPGVVVLTRDGKRTRRYSSGVANVATGRPIRVADRFRIASLTKTYTATVALQLVAERRLSLRDTVERWVPGLVPRGDAITVRQLLAQTSGLFDYENDPRVLQPYLSGDFGFEWQPRALVEIAVSHPPLFTPGSRHQYSNTNYVLAQLVIEAVTGRSLGRELERRIFEPLRLRRTIYPTSPEIPGRHAHGYMNLGAPTPTDVTGISPSLEAGAGAIISTARDVARFYRPLLAGRLLPARLMRAMRTTLPGAPVDIPGQRYGLGLISFPTKCGLAWGHNGVEPGYLAYAYTSGDGRRQSVVLLNLDAGSFSDEAKQIFPALVESAYCSTA